MHPEPAENCPCFEDAIAFVSVFAGILVGRNWSPVDWTHATVGAGWTTPFEGGLWVAAIAVKVVLGEVSCSCSFSLAMGWNLIVVDPQASLLYSAGG